jgi:hypothetical protein
MGNLSYFVTHLKINIFYFVEAPTVFRMLPKQVSLPRKTEYNYLFGNPLNKNPRVYV